MSELIFSSAVLTMSQTTEFIRNKSVDNTVLNLIIQRRRREFTLDEAYLAIHEDLPIRKEEVWNSIQRSYESQTIELVGGQQSNKTTARFRIPDQVTKKIDEQCDELKVFLDDSVKELFKGLYTSETKEKYKDLLLDVVTKLMAKYGYAYAGQLAGVGDATEFVPLKDLKKICQDSIAQYELSITPEDLSNSIGILFDRRDPCLNSLAFSICNRYYITRLIGLDIPIEFVSKNLFEGSKIFLDTNLIMTIVYSRSKRHNEFREILKKADEIGIKFAVSEITLAELHRKVDHYQSDLEIGSEIVPEDLLTEVQGQILESPTPETEATQFNPNESIHKERLTDMGVEYIPVDKELEKWSPEVFEAAKNEIAKFDRKYRRMYLAKNENALFHDTYLYFLIQGIRNQSEDVGAWFLTLDNSIIEHGISTKKEGEPPYSIRLFSLLQTLSQFVESQAIKGEFSDLFGELVSKDLLPREQLFSVEDLKLLIGFDIRAKEIPPEFVRKATLHIKQNILKGGEITDKNKSEAIHEFTKFLATPEQNFVEIRKKYDKKLKDRDEDLKLKEQEIQTVKSEVAVKNDEISNLEKRLKELEIDNAKEKLSRAEEKFESHQSSYADLEWTSYRSSLKSIRTRYLVFIAVSLVAFTCIFFIESLLGFVGVSISLSNWVKYPLAVIVFLAPYIRSFFEHKKVMTSFRMWSKSYRRNLESTYKRDSKKEYESIHNRPKLEDYLKKQSTNTQQQL